MTVAKENIYQLAPHEVEIMRASASDPNIFFEYWCKKPGLDPFQLDYKFEEGAKWQKDFCMAEQSLIVAICGIATGKTLACGMSAFYHGSITPYFKFMNVGHELMQAKFMYDEILAYTEGTRAEQLIWKKPAAPHPKIVIAYKIGDVKVTSTLDFQSAGEASDALQLFSYRGDWINIEEAGRFNNLEEIVSRLTTRLTGASASGRPYMGRLSVISNPIDNPQLWSLFDRAVDDPENAATFMIDTNQNKNVTDKQLAAQLRNIPEEEQDFYLSGKRPEGRGAFFSRKLVQKCESDLLSEKLREGIVSNEDGWRGVYDSVLGYYDWKFPRRDNHSYIVVGDPGTGKAPLRNAPAIMAFDVTDAPRINTICGMWWGNGMGRITSWIEHLLEFMAFYRPDFVGVDSTASQKNMAEVINMEYVTDQGYSVNQITGMDFSGIRKLQYLVSSRVTFELGALAYPSIATGISSQLKSYDIVEDRSTTSKLAQDLVCCVAMGTFASRALYPPVPPEDDDKQDDKGESQYKPTYSRTRNRSYRNSIRSSRR